MSGPIGDVYLEAYPSRILCLSLGQFVLSNALGALIIWRIHALLGASYLVLCAASLVVGLKYRCRFCWYFGRRCYAGLGRLAKLMFQPGEPQEFRRPENLVPAAIFSFTVLLLPLMVILVISVTGFSWLNLGLLLSYALIAVVPGFMLRKNLFCDHCKQAELGCPAYEGMQGMQGKHGTKT